MDILAHSHVFALHSFPAPQEHGEKRTMTMQFTLPSAVEFSKAPKPLDPAVTIKQVRCLPGKVLQPAACLWPEPPTWRASAKQAFL